MEINKFSKRGIIGNIFEDRIKDEILRNYEDSNIESKSNSEF